MKRKVLHFTERNPTALCMCERFVAQSCPTLCNPRDCSLPDSSVHGIFKAKILEWVSFPSPGDLPNTGIKLTSPALVGRFFTRVSWGAQLLFSSQQILFSKCKCDKFYLQSTQQTISSPETAYILCWHVLELIRVAKFMSHTRGHQQ